MHTNEWPWWRGDVAEETAKAMSPRDDMDDDERDEDAEEEDDA